MVQASPVVRKRSTADAAGKGASSHRRDKREQISWIGTSCRAEERMPRANSKSAKIMIQRAYEEPGPDDGYRVLVDRVWPHGRSKETLKLDQWSRELAPSAQLRE